LLGVGKDHKRNYGIFALPEVTEAIFRGYHCPKYLLLAPFYLLNNLCGPLGKGEYLLRSFAAITPRTGAENYKDYHLCSALFLISYRNEI